VEVVSISSLSAVLKTFSLSDGFRPGGREGLSHPGGLLGCFLHQFPSRHGSLAGTRPLDLELDDDEFSNVCSRPVDLAVFG